MRHRQSTVLAALLAAAAAAMAQPQAAVPVGQQKGTAAVHDAASAARLIAGAQLALPVQATGGDAYFGSWQSAPRTVAQRVPVVVFLHGSSGLGLKAIEEWQRWLAGLGIASVAPDSFALPDRITYTSPVERRVYERLHALRSSEIALALQALAVAPWADTSRMVLAGTSEGATAVARHDSSAFVGRIIYSWSCEANYFVDEPATAASPGRPVLNIISANDPYFSPTNPWLGNAWARGHCAEALKSNPQATIVLLPQAPHTLINLPAARGITEVFLRPLLLLR